MEMKSASHKTREIKQWDRRQSQSQTSSKDLASFESVEQKMLPTAEQYSYGPTAPIVGRHDKGNSLVGFDPLLQETSSNIKIHNPFSSTAVVDIEDVPPAANESESRGELEGTTVNRQANEEELRTELRAIATELGRSSPKKKRPSPIQTRKQYTRAPPSPLEATSPVHRVQLAWQKKIQGKCHRKSRSLDSKDDTFKEAGSLISQKDKAKGTDGDDNRKRPTAAGSMRHLLTTSSSMIQDLWDLQRQAGTDSCTSSSQQHPLNKPRATSFLTGKEVVLTSELDATDWQLSIPSKSEFEFTFKASQFLDTYRTKECLLDLDSLVGYSRLGLCELATGNSLQGSKVKKIATFHQPIVEALLECGDDILMVRGYFKSDTIDGNPDSFREVLVLERQHQFLCVFRGTTAEQLGKVDRQPVAIKLMDNGGVSVFKDRYKSVQEFEPALFALLDKLMEESPFCDFCFAGHAFGAAMATLAAYRYAYARSELRVSAVVSGSAKVGLADFRISANSLSNLKVVRVELGYARPTANAGFHIGHTVRIHATRHPARQTVRAYKFADCKQDPSVIHKLRLVKGKTSAAYVRALEDLGNVWAKDFYRQDGVGVRGQNNEEREMV
jgi:Lipase (class 3)